MIGKSLRKLTVLAAGITVAAGFAGKSAHAERVISDYEASKLTLEALTAAPVYRPVIRHHYVAAHVRPRSYAVASRHTTSRNMVHYVAFRTVRHPAHAVHTRHRT